MRLTGPRMATWRRVVFAFVLTFAALTVFGGAFAAGYARFHDGRVLPGVEVGGVSLAGLDQRAAEAELRRVLPDLGEGRLTLRISDRVAVIGYSDIGRDYDMARMLDDAFSIGRSGTDPLDDVQQQLRTFMSGVSVAPSVTWDARLLADLVTAATRAAEAPAVDASVARPAGVYVASPSSQGRSIDAAAAVALAAAAIDNLSPADVTIEVPSAVIQPAIATMPAQAAVDRANRVAAAPLTVSADGTTSTIAAAEINAWLRLDRTSGDAWGLVIESGPIAQFVDLLTARVDVEPTNASFTFVRGKAAVVPDAQGRRIERQEAVDAILAALQQRADGILAAGVDLPIVSVPPELTTAAAQRLISRIELLSSWTTSYTASALNGFGINITRPTELIDGTVVGPGELFDFVAVAGPITEENGYTQGAAIINGNTKLDGVLGGGLCSTSTTLFNAALRAGLEINARRAHFYYIDRYPVGLDATIWISGSRVTTVAFTNDSQYPVLVRGIATERKVTFEIWGVPDGRQVSFSEPEVWDEQESWTEIEYTDDLPPGETERVEWAFDGFKSLVTRTVTAADGELLHQDSFGSNYRRVTGLIRLGRSPDDPPAGTIIRQGQLPLR